MGLALSKHFWSDDISESRSVVYGFRDVLQDGWRKVRFHVHIRRDVTWFYVWVMFTTFEVERDIQKIDHAYVGFDCNL